MYENILIRDEFNELNKCADETMFQIDSIKLKDKVEIAHNLVVNNDLESATGILKQILENGTSYNDVIKLRLRVLIHSIARAIKKEQIKQERQAELNSMAKPPKEWRAKVKTCRVTEQKFIDKFSQRKNLTKKEQQKLKAIRENRERMREQLLKSLNECISLSEALGYTATRKRLSLMYESFERQALRQK